MFLGKSVGNKNGKEETKKVTKIHKRNNEDLERTGQNRERNVKLKTACVLLSDLSL